MAKRKCALGNLAKIKREFMLMELDIYKNKRVLITGHTGFKGSWLSLWLSRLGAEVCGYSLNPNTNPSMFDELRIKNKIASSIIGDILDESRIKQTVKDFKPEIIFHLAAQPLVRESYRQPILTYKTNVIGTLNLLEAARNVPSVKAFVNITTDKCYENKETLNGYKENDALGGYDMYSSSKACSEILSASYRRSFLKDSGYALATARAGNVIGGGDWAIDRLIPDCIKSINSGNVIEIRNPDSVRPWQHVLEPLYGYLLLGEKLLSGNKNCEDSFNFGPDENSIIKVRKIANDLVKYYGAGEIIYNKTDDLHEANLLVLNTDKARKILGWKPKYNIDESLKSTVDWYKNFYDKSTDMYEFTMRQIQNYEEVSV